MSQKLTQNLNEFLDTHFFSQFESNKAKSSEWAKKPAFQIWNSNTESFDIKNQQQLLDLTLKIAHCANTYEKPRLLIVSNSGFFSMAAMLAAWHTGGHFIPISKEQKLSSVEDLIKILKPDLILFDELKNAEESLQKSWPEDWLLKTRIFNSESLSPFSLDGVDSIMLPTLKAKVRSLDDLSYIISTSGTTGSPKLIPVKDRNLLSYIQNIQILLPPDEVDGMLQTFPISFDPAIEDLLWALIKKAYLIPCDFKTLRYFEKFNLKNEKLWWASTPSTGAQLLKLLPVEKMKSPPILKQIKHSFFMGEKLTYQFSKKWKNAFSNSDIYNLYGPAETTITISYFKIIDFSIESGAVPIGKIHDHHSSFLNENFELVITGPQVIENYLQNPSTSFSKVSEQNSFNTRDICTASPAGYTLIGRSDHMVKINGIRFEPEDMETYLDSHQISGLIIPVEDTNGDLKLFLVSEKKGINKESINQLIQSKYGIAFLIKKIVYLDAIPKNKNQKVDRKKIKELIQAMAPE